MNLKECKEKALMIIREYSNGGSIIGTGDNADYLLSINSFISDAQFEISKKRPIIEDYILNNPLVKGSYSLYSKPDDYEELIKITLDDFDFDNFRENFKDIMLPTTEGEYTLWYSKTPTRYITSSLDTVELEIDRDIQHIACYYAAAMILQEENPEIAQLIKNEYLRLLSGVERKELKNSNVIYSVFSM